MLPQALSPRGLRGFRFVDFLVLACKERWGWGVDDVSFGVLEEGWFWF